MGKLANDKIEQALLLMDKLAKKNAALEQERTEPIAIIGMGCRFPGGARHSRGLSGNCSMQVGMPFNS